MQNIPLNLGFIATMFAVMLYLEPMTEIISTIPLGSMDLEGIFVLIGLLGIIFGFIVKLKQQKDTYKTKIKTK